MPAVTVLEFEKGGGARMQLESNIVFVALFFQRPVFEIIFVVSGCRGINQEAK